MDVRFVAQPFEDGTDLRDYFRAVSDDSQFTTLRIIVAWAKRSGLGRAARDLATIRTRGSRVLAIVGVSEGGATEQGLRALIEQTDEAHVFHDRGRTFHPKVYLADGPSSALLLVGSHNLTAGGFAWNYEAGTWCTLDLSVEADRKVRDAVVTYFDRLRADADVCVPLTTESLSAILSDPALLIQNEDTRRAPKATQPDAPEETDSTGGSDESEAEAPTFGVSRERKRTLPPLAPKTPVRRPPRQPVPTTGGISAVRPDIIAARRWYKRLDGTAAQRPPGPTSKPTGNLRLSQEDFAIDWKIYFVNVFFGGLDWRPSEHVKSMEEVWVPTEVMIGSDYLGAISLRLSHQPSRISNQGNVPTVLHWGDLSARMRANNYVGQYITLERSVDDVFALTIAEEPTGPFLY